MSRTGHTAGCAIGVAAIVTALLGGCAQGQPEETPMTESTGPNTASAAPAADAAQDQGAAAMRLVMAVPGTDWQTPADRVVPQASDCSIESDGESLVLQWYATGSKPTDGKAYIAKVSAALQDAGYEVRTRSSSLEDYGDSYQVVGSKDLVSAVVVAANDNGTSADTESVCAAGDPEDFPR